MNYLRGAIDIHVHSSPSIFPRSVDDLELARLAQQAGMRAIVLKAHEESTVSRAFLVNKVVTGIDVYGSLVLNEYVGGLNPYAVDLAVQQGAKIIWMPTGSAKHHLAFYGGKSDYDEQKSRVRLLPQKGITILDDEGRLLPVVYDIIDLIKGSGAALATGHLSPQESRILVKTALARGVEKVLVAHPGNGAPLSARVPHPRENGPGTRGGKSVGRPSGFENQQDGSGIAMRAGQHGRLCRKVHAHVDAPLEIHRTRGVGARHPPHRGKTVHFADRFGTGQSPGAH